MRFFPAFPLIWVLGLGSILLFLVEFLFFIPPDSPFLSPDKKAYRAVVYSLLSVLGYLPCYFLGFSIGLYIGW
ncbi:MAG: hypothetical protein ACTSWC_07430 [Promethearchaeota archaeon]